MGNQGLCLGVVILLHLTPFPHLSQPLTTPTVKNMHHSLDSAHICVDAAGRGRCVCVVCVCVCFCEGLLQGALDKWRCHMVRPDVPVSYVHSSSKTTTGATIGSLLSSKASQPICFLPAKPQCIVGPGYFCRAFAVSNQFCFLIRERKCQHQCCHQVQL